jgi:transposase-like protein
MENSAIYLDFKTALEEVLRTGARELLQQAIEHEVQECLGFYKAHQLNKKGESVKRNGYLPSREIQTGLGPIEITQPRVRGAPFTSNLIPKYKRRVRSIEALIPELYLKGVSTGNMQEALKALLGKEAPGLSSSTVVRLKETWAQEYHQWQRRDLSTKHYVYVWADGIYFNLRLSAERPCLLVLIGATAEGTKEFIAMYDGVRESKLSWKEVLQDLKHRGMKQAPLLGIGDGALGFWAALEEEFPSCQQQRCWVHKTANVLDKLPQSVQVHAKKLIHEMYLAPTKEQGVRAFEGFKSVYGAKYPKACSCLEKDKERLFIFYDFPAIHWQHIRTTNPIESTFATVRHRSTQTKGCGSREATLSMVYKLGMSAQRRWQKLRGHELMVKVIQGIKFKDGEEVEEVA